MLRFQHDHLNFSDSLFDMSAVLNTGNHAVLISELCSVDVVIIALNGMLVYSCHFR